VLLLKMVKREGSYLMLSIYTILLLLLFISIFAWSGITPEDIYYKFNNPISYNNVVSIVIDDDINTILSTRFNSDNKEFIYCVYGYEEEGILYINEIKETNVFKTNATALSYEQCKGRTLLGTIHNHQTGNCDLSIMDAYSFGSTGETLIGVICGKSKYGLYGTDNVNNVLGYEIKDIQ